MLPNRIQRLALRYYGVVIVSVAVRQPLRCSLWVAGTTFVTRGRLSQILVKRFPTDREVASDSRFLSSLYDKVIEW